MKRLVRVSLREREMLEAQFLALTCIDVVACGLESVNTSVPRKRVYSWPGVVHDRPTAAVIRSTYLSVENVLGQHITYRIVAARATREWSRMVAAAQLALMVVPSLGHSMVHTPL